MKVYNNVIANGPEFPSHVANGGIYVYFCDATDSQIKNNIFYNNINPYLIRVNVGANMSAADINNNIFGINN